MLTLLLAVACAPLPTKGDQHDWALVDVRALVWANDNSAVVAGTASGEIVVWDARSGRELARWKADEKLVALSLRGDLLATGNNAGRIQLWNWKTGKLVKAFRTAENLRSLCLHPDGKSLATVSARSAARWDLFTAKRLQGCDSLHEHGTAWSVAHSPDGKQVLIAGESHEAGGWRGAWCSRWDFATKDEPLGGGGGSTQNPDPVWNTRRLGHCIAWMPDSQYAYYPGVDAIHGFARKGSAGSTSHCGYPVGFAYSPDGKHIVYADESGIVRKLDGQSLRTLATSERFGPIEQFALSPDGKRFVVANKRKVMLRLLPGELSR